MVGGQSTCVCVCARYVQLAHRRDGLGEGRNEEEKKAHRETHLKRDDDSGESSCDSSLLILPILYLFVRMTRVTKYYKKTFEEASGFVVTPLVPPSSNVATKRSEEQNKGGRGQRREGRGKPYGNSGR